ncbi:MULTISPECIES: hypothetical protein [unclassified Leifsonia]|uniref:hypothetical protein n=1 Tax=unclassified Leifsonia TaxID=2663824 RepID=UPI0003612CB6|nr:MULTISPECIES: hypothetical protein [unclassified Leifsonia]TDQ03278.1 hypothetical protein AXZ95_1562 [Leifsonia sp. 115AMFTsu3.1]
MTTTPITRKNVVAVRLDDEELVRWKTAAYNDGRSQVGQWVRESIEESLGMRAPVTTRSSKLIGVLRLQNQALSLIAHHLEHILKTGAISDEVLQRIERAVFEAKQIRTEDDE